MCPLTSTPLSYTSLSATYALCFFVSFLNSFSASLWNFKTLISTWSAPEDNATMEPSSWRRMHPESPGNHDFATRRTLTYCNEIRRPVLRGKQSLVCTMLRLKLNFLFRRTGETWVLFQQKYRAHKQHVTLSAWLQETQSERFRTAEIFEWVELSYSRISYIAYLSENCNVNEKFVFHVL